MAEIASMGPVTIRQTRSPRPATLNVVGGWIIAASEAIVQAVAMAYVEPFRPRPPAGKKVDPDGRDTNW